MNRLDLSIHYLARVIEGSVRTSSNSNPITKPPLSSHLVVNLFMLISQVFFVCFTNNNSPDLPESDCKIVQTFVSSTIPGLTVELSQLKLDDCVSYCYKLIAKLKTIAVLGNSSIVTPFSRLSCAFDEMPFEPHFFKYRVDHLKSLILDLDLTIAKMRFSQSVMNIPQNMMILRQTFFELSDMVSNSVHKIEPNENLAFVFLGGIADHYEAVRTISPSLVLGTFSYSQYAFLADLYLFDQYFPELKLAKLLNTSSNNLSQIKDGLLQAARILLLSYMNSCTLCLDAYPISEIYFQKATKVSRKTVPCQHRFTLKSEM